MAGGDAGGDGGPLIDELVATAELEEEDEDVEEDEGEGDGGEVYPAPRCVS